MIMIMMLVIMKTVMLDIIICTDIQARRQAPPAAALPSLVQQSRPVSAILIVKEYQELTPLSRIFTRIAHTGVPYFPMGR